MAISSYKTKQGRRFQAAVWLDGKKVATQAGFTTKRAATEWLAAQTAGSHHPSAKTPTVLAVASSYLDDVQSRRKGNTYAHKRAILKRFLSSIGPDITLEQVDRSLLREFLAEINKEKGAKSANRTKVVLSAFFHWAKNEGQLRGPVPTVGLEQYPEERYRRYIPPARDIAAVTMAATGWQRDYILLLLHTAARSGEIVKLRWEDTNLQDGTITLWTSKRAGGNLEPRTQATTETALEILLRRWSAPDRHPEFVFTDSLGRPLDKKHKEFQFVMQRLCKRVGVKQFTAHALRHYVASMMADGHKCDVRSAQKLLGHQNLKTTEIYLRSLDVDRQTASLVQSIGEETMGKPQRKLRMVK